METQNRVYRSDNLLLFEPTHPGEVLKEELEARSITQKKFAQMLNVHYTFLNNIVKGKHPVATDMALMQESARGIEATFWINLQTCYNVQLARRDQHLAERLSEIRKICASIL